MEFPVRSRPAKFKASPSDERGGGHRAVKPETRSKRDVYQGLEFREFDQDREDLNFGSEMDSMSLTQRPFRTPAVPRSEFSFGRSGRLAVPAPARSGFRALPFSKITMG